MLYLSKNFTLYEFTKSETAKLLKIDNTPAIARIENLQSLVFNILQPLRDYLKRPVIISSGFRSAALNFAVGGVSNSQHIDGRAADIFCSSAREREEIFEFIASSCSFDQLIKEKNSADEIGWIHVSFVSREANRKQIIENLIKNKGG